MGELDRSLFNHRAIGKHPRPGKPATVRGNFLPEERGLPIGRLERRHDGILQGL